MIKFTKKKIILSVFAIIIVGIAVFAAHGILGYFGYRKAAEASASMPWQDAGTITYYMPQCVLDTPATSPTTCAISCPLSVTALASACVGYSELWVTGQNGTTYIDVPIGFVYSGGGTVPAVGMSFIAGGSSNVSPWVIGIPGASASRIQKLADAFKFIIATIR
ncbi:MAG: hypothetical protein AAB906_02730 [Patescibacteria group bacterium]